MTRVAVYTGWRDVPEDIVDGVAELRDVLDRISHRHPGRHVLTRLVREGGEELMIGTGPLVGLATITLASRQVVYNALGDTEFTKRQSIVSFEWGRQRLEMGPENLLPPVVAQQIADKWLTDGSRDQTVKWENAVQREGN